MINIAKKYNTIGIHAFSIDDEVDAYGRNFAPVVGINEESATGTSNGALSSYLYNYVNKKESYILRQGYSMNQPSEIMAKLEVENQDIKKVYVGGTAKILSR
jgi:PhzF family phenazine biosynthesis protein